MSNTATIEPKAKASSQAQPPRKPVLHQKVYYWYVKRLPGPNDPPLAPDENPCMAWIAGFGPDGEVNLAIMTPTGRMDNKMNVPYSHDPKGLHWTWKNSGNAV